MFKLGIVGAGIIGKDHAKAILRNDDCVLTAVCDTVLSRAEEAARQHGAQSCTDYREMADKADMDGVILNLPHFLHREAAVYFLDRGIHVLVEKPMAMTAAECDSMMEAARKSGAKLAVGHVQKYFPAIEAVKKILEEEKYGKLCMVTEVRNIDYLSNRPKWFLEKAKAGGGIVMNYGAHTLDRLMYVTGERVKEIKGYLTNPLSGDDVEINAQLLLKLENGVTANVTYCGCPGVGLHETAFYFEKGVAKVKNSSLLYLSQDGEFVQQPEEDADIIYRQLCEFIKCLKGEESAVATPQYSREIVRVLEGIFAEGEYRLADGK